MASELELAKKQVESSSAELTKAKDRLAGAEKEVEASAARVTDIEQQAQETGIAAGGNCTCDGQRAMNRLGILALAAALSSSAAALAVEPVDFAHDVLPLLQQQCAKCHTNGRYEGDLSFDTRESILQSGAGGTRQER